MCKSLKRNFYLLTQRRTDTSLLPNTHISKNQPSQVLAMRVSHCWQVHWLLQKRHPYSESKMLSGLDRCQFLWEDSKVSFSKGNFLRRGWPWRNEKDRLNTEKNIDICIELAYIYHPIVVVRTATAFIPFNFPAKLGLNNIWKIISI